MKALTVIYKLTLEIREGGGESTSVDSESE